MTHPQAFPAQDPNPQVPLDAGTVTDALADDIPGPDEVAATGSEAAGSVPSDSAGAGTDPADVAPDGPRAGADDADDADTAGAANDARSVWRAPDEPAPARELNEAAVESVRALEDPAAPHPAPQPAGTERVGSDAQESDALPAAETSHAGTATAASAEGAAQNGDRPVGPDADVDGPAGRGTAAGTAVVDGPGVVGGTGVVEGPGVAANPEVAERPAAGDAASRRRTPSHEQLVAEGDAAGDYLERLLDILDYDGDIDLDVDGERAVVSIIGDSADVAKLVGERGEVLDALQELTRLAATAETGQRSRLMLDVAGFRAQRRIELSELGTRTAEQVLRSGEPARLTPMNPFERKIVHDAVATVTGVASSSEGEEPRRRVVVSPAAG